MLMRFSPENIGELARNMRNKTEEVWKVTKDGFDVMNRNRSTTGSVVLGLSLGGHDIWNIGNTWALGRSAENY